MHPACLTDEKLLAECTSVRQRRSGPGGQHRNKVETAIRLEHTPTGRVAMASERRSQAENLAEAIFRLRVELALTVRSKGGSESPTELWKSRSRGGKLAVNPTHTDFPALLAEALDVVYEMGGDHTSAAVRLQISGSQLAKFLRYEPRAWGIFNQLRETHGLPRLK